MVSYPALGNQNREIFYSLCHRREDAFDALQLSVSVFMVRC